MDRDVPLEVCQCKHLFFPVFCPVNWVGPRAGSMFNVLKFHNLGWGSMMVYSKARAGHPGHPLQFQGPSMQEWSANLEFRNIVPPCKANAIWHRDRLPGVVSCCMRFVVALQCSRSILSMLAPAWIQRSARNRTHPPIGSLYCGISARPSKA